MLAIASVTFSPVKCGPSVFDDWRFSGCVMNVPVPYVLHHTV